VSCNHELCGKTQKIWLQFEVRGHQKGLKAHPYCIECGMIKSISSDRARPLGYYMNILSSLRISKVQTRLIAKEMEDLGDFDDAFSISLFLQEQNFIRIVKKYSSISEKAIIGAL
jgi:hypothetical protein